MKKIIVLMLIGCLCTACGTTDNEAPKETETTVEVEAEASSDEEAAVKPIPVSMESMMTEGATVAVSFEEGDAYADDKGSMRLDITMYTYDLYDMADMENLKEGDTIVIQGENVVADSVERLESGMMMINGGLENGGYDFWHNDSGVYFESGMNDAKSYYVLGQGSFDVSPDFEFADSSDLEKGEVIYYPGDFLTDDAGIIYDFTPHNTSVVIENGQIMKMIRVYTP